MTCETFRVPRHIRILTLKVSVAVIIGAFVVVAPRPRLVEESAMATETRRPFAGQPEPTSTTTDAPPWATTTTTQPDGGTSTTEQPPTTSAPSESTSTTDQPQEDGDQWATVTEDTRDFNLIGVTLASMSSSPVRVRTAARGGAWGPWEELEFEAEGALAPVAGAPVPQEPDTDAPGAHSDPLWVGDADRYQLGLPANLVTDAQVHLVYETTRKVAVAETAPAGADPAGPAIFPRSSWGARPPKVTPTIAPALKIAVVHHTAGTSDYSSAEVPAVLRSVQAYHMDANGWNDIGYNFAVDRFGRVWEARSGGVTRAVIGGHARGFNTGSTGVVVLGNFETAVPSSAAVNSVGSLLAWKFAVHDVDPRTTVAFRAGEGSPKYPPGTVLPMNRIVGHRDVGLTACPGANLYRHLSTIRTSVSRAYPTLAAAGLALVGNFAGSGAGDIFLRQPGVLRDQLLVGSGGGAFSTLATFSVRGTAYRPRVGDFDGNGYDDILWYGPGPVSDSLWLSRGNGGFTSVALTVRGVYKPVIGDFDANGADDIFWYAPGAPLESMWLARGGGRFGHVAGRSVPHTLRAEAGDFDGDGDDDILWHGPGPALGDSIWVAQDGVFTSRTIPNTQGSYLPAIGDFDDNGDDDIFWYAPGSPPESVWLSADLRFRAVSVPPVRGLYPYARSGDYDGNGRDEVLWYSSPGQDSIWWHASSSALFGRPLATSPALR